ncbi:NFYB/HAP3 family transcription factor subunit [Candidatus Woesearchaeota archaeon]|nr:NFYB/HAP3 family transcription factor subunit [Candidatus Woesearchaeota archaeon]
MHIIPRATVARILIRSGAKRVSAKAADAFAEIIEQIAEDIGQKSVKLAKHSGRKTVKEKDIKLAVK